MAFEAVSTSLLQINSDIQVEQDPGIRMHEAMLQSRRMETKNIKSRLTFFSAVTLIENTFLKNICSLKLHATAPPCQVSSNSAPLCSTKSNKIMVACSKSKQKSIHSIKHHTSLARMMMCLLEWWCCWTTPSLLCTTYINHQPEHMLNSETKPFSFTWFYSCSLQ